MNVIFVKKCIMDEAERDMSCAVWKWDMLIGLNNLMMVYFEGSFNGSHMKKKLIRVDNLEQ